MVTTEERVSRLEGAYEQLDERLGDIIRSIEAMRSDLNNRFGDLNNRISETNDRINETNNRINHLYAVMFGLWATTILAIVGLYFRT